MILQTDSRLTPVLNRYGCYFMSILFLGNKYTGFQLSTKKILDLFDYAVDCGWVDYDQAFINDPDGIFAEMSLHTLYHDRHDPSWVVCQPDEIEILRFVRGAQKHFCAGTGEGHVAYDPMGTSRTVREGAMRDKRIFKLIGRRRL